MDWYAILKRHYDAGRYDEADVRKFVAAGKINEEQYEAITAESYAGTA
ncbi:hypothetical protein B1A99_29950 [Cohnella sp. CIP 111063]|jgi:phage uncharacterized protein, XkdX family|nr:MULTISPECIES: XkdX family protein [unclassified Cohnella]OXS53290.1 hypothetical protein B1A99_29950 [Cohnella sp. CIP 111063]PRX61023.1 putative XkdX family phage protein [Cohnella sp. SGD-V74]